MKKKTSIIVILIILLAIVYLYIDSRMLSSGNEYLPNKEALKRLNSLNLEVKEGIATFGDARVERRGGNIILHLKGTPYEMGYQHGILLKEDILNGVVPVFADPIGHTSEYRDKPAWLKKFMMKYLEFAVYAPVEKNTPREYLEELRGIADGAGLDYRRVFIANFLSDLTMAMIPGVVNKKAKSFGAYLECSDFAASGAATQDGKLIIGRDTDYGGLNRWRDHQTIFFYQPEGGHPYVKVSTAGLIKCNSAMNEKGMVVGGHFMGFYGSTPAGVSFTILENEIMRKAASIDDAISIVRNSRRGGTFGFMVADGKTRKAVVIEATAELLGVRDMQKSTICLTNFATTPELKEVDLFAKYNVVMRDLVGRYTRYEQLIEKNYGRITPELAAEFVSDHYDVIAGKERGVGITTGAITNVTSVVFQPEDGFFWVATGGAPACTNEYLGFDFRAELQGGEPRVSPTVLKGYQWTDPSHKLALGAYMKAFENYTENPDDIESVIKFLNQARKADPYEPVFNRILAAVLIHKGVYPSAVRLLRESLDLPQSNNGKALIHLQAGQGYDLMGKRENALKMYHTVLSLREEHGRDFLTGINDMVYAFARKHIEAPFSIGDINDIPIGFGLGTGLE